MPSSQCHWKSSAEPTTIVITLTTSSTMPNAIQRRSMLMSCIMRLSSCPDCHLSWNETGSRCRRA